MAFTTPTVPGPTTQTGANVAVSDSFDTHAAMHGRHLTGATENPRAHGAVGNGSHDDTDAFVKAIRNLQARAPLGQPALYIPGGLFLVDGDAIRDELISIQGWRFYGDGHSSAIVAKSGATCGFGVDRAINCSFENLNFGGRAKAGPESCFRLTGPSQANVFYNVRFNAGLIGCSLEVGTGAGDLSQVDKNLFLNCFVSQCGTGVHVNADNAQCQVWIGGNISGCTVGMRASLGWFHQIGGMVQDCETAYQLDTGTNKLLLENLITEGGATGIDVVQMSAPAVIYMRNVILQGTTSNINSASGLTIDAEWCEFNGGPVTPGNNSMFYDKRNTFGSGATYDIAANPTDAVRIRHTTTDVEYYNTGPAGTDGATPIRKDSLTGYIESREITAPDAGGANTVRLFPRDDGSGNTQLCVRFTSGQIFVVETQVALSTYTATNVSTDRAYDANATTTDELADVLGTLIADLRARGIVL